MLHKLKPARMNAKPAKVIADLDDLIAEPVAFRFQGKTWVLKPVDTETFMRVARALEDIQELLSGHSGGEPKNKEEIYDAYLVFIQPLCEGIGMTEIRSMTLPQLHALMSLIIRHITGQTTQESVSGSEEEKKKTLTS